MMSRLIIIAAIAFLCGHGHAQTINVTQAATDFGLSSNAVKNITMTPIAPAGDYNGMYLVNQPIQPSFFTNGTGVFSNIVSGYAYKINFQAYNSTYRTNFFPSALGGNVNGHDYTGWIIGTAKDGSVIQFAYLYSTNSGASLAAGSGIYFTTNGIYTVINATGGGSVSLTNLTWGVTTGYTTADRQLSMRLIFPAIPYNQTNHPYWQQSTN